MATDTITPRSRRAILAGALGAVAASVAHALGRPAAVRAGVDGDVVLGASNSTMSPTSVTNTAGSGNGLAGHTFGSGDGIAGSSHSGSGVRGTSASSTGVYGESLGSAAGVVGTGASLGVTGTSTNGTGVNGSSGLGIGVNATSNATNQAAGRGWSAGNSTGLLGYSGGSVPAAPAKTGVAGIATQDGNSRGVHGKSTMGRGVFGEATSGLGVRGYATSGVGLSGGATSGYALRTDGRVRFDKSAGIATISAGTKSILVTPGIELTATTAVHTTLQGSAGGTTNVHRVAIDAAANTFRIYLTANATVNVKVAWLAIG